MAKHFNFEVIPLPNVPLGPRLMTNSVRPQSILVVDDEPLIANTLVAILRTKNYTAQAAYNGYEAMEIAERMLPDILLTDVMMPDMNGIDLAIAFTELIPNCKVLLISGHAYLGHLLEDTRCSVHNFPLLSKPIHPEELLAEISSLTQPAGSAA
jgi:YesN/AraC family two-component response regulator